MATKVVGDAETLKKIGNTPLVKLNSLSSGKVTAYAKLESHNPFGSVKDRDLLALYMPLWKNFL